MAWTMHRESPRRTNASSPGLQAADAPVVLSVSGFHQRLERAIEAAHLRRVWLRGTVSGVRTRGRVLTFELVEYMAGTAHAVLPMTLFPSDALRVERRLAAGASELVDGLEATFLVELEGNGAFGIVRGVVRDARTDAHHSQFSQNREALL